MPSQTELTGGCACKAVRYRITGQPIVVYACHCTDCQKQSGSAFALSMVVRMTDLHITQGQLKSFTRKADSGRTMTCKFCGDCGTRIYNAREDLTETCVLKPGTLDDTSRLKPVAHIWMQSAQPWVVIAPGIATYQTQPEKPSDLLKHRTQP